MAELYLKWDLSDLDIGRLVLRQSRTFSLVLFAATHGLWLVICLAGLAFALTNAFYSNAHSALATGFLER